jgi:hypothetical protein
LLPGDFFFAGRGPISIDRLLVPPFELSAQSLEKAISALRLGLGLSLVFVAFTEKFGRKRKPKRLGASNFRT